jgi:hypothetical protein
MHPRATAATRAEMQSWGMIRIIHPLPLPFDEVQLLKIAMQPAVGCEFPAWFLLRDEQQEPAIFLISAL